MSAKELKALVNQAEDLLKTDAQHYTDMSKEILLYKIKEAKRVLSEGNEEKIKFFTDGNGWAMLKGLKGDIELYKRKYIEDVEEVERLNNLSRRSKAKYEKALKSKDDYLFFSKQELAKIKENIKQPLLNREWQRIKSLADEYSLEDSNNIKENYKAWRLLPFNFHTKKNTRYAKVEFVLDDGEIYVDRIALNEAKIGSTKIKNTALEGAVLVSSDIPETYGNQGRSPVVEAIFISSPNKLFQKDLVPVNEETDYTLNLFIKQQNKLKNPFVIKVHLYDDAFCEIQTEAYEWNRLTHIRWDYMFERSCADAIVYLLTDEVDYAIKAKNEIIYMLEDMKQTGVLYWLQYNSKPFDDGYGTVHMGRAMPGLCMIYDIITKNNNVISYEDVELIKNGIFFISDYLGQGVRAANEGLEYYPELHDKDQLLKGGNWTTDQYVGLGYFAITFPKHPLSFIYLENSKTVVYEHLEHLTNPEGIWPESARYHFAVLKTLVLYAIALKKHDGTDLTLNEKFKKMYEYALETQLPQYEYINNEISHLIFGDDRLGTGQDFFHFNIASKLFRDTDPLFADRLLATWGKSGRHIAFGGLNGWLLPFIMIDFSNFAKEKVGGLKSVCYPNFGIAVLRSNAETDRDTHVSVICSKNFGAHGHFDLGSFSFIANKVPVSLDPGVVSYWDNSLKWFRSSEAHSTVQFNGQNVLNADGLGMVPDYENGIWHFESNDDYDYVALTVNNPNGSGKQIRHIILEKQISALIVYDEIKKYKGVTTFNLPLCAQETRIVGSEVFSKGYFGCNIYTKIILPENPSVALSKGAIAKGMIPSETQDYIRINAYDDQCYLVAIVPSMNGEYKKIHVEMGEGFILVDDKKINIKTNLT